MANFLDNNQAALGASQVGFNISLDLNQRVNALRAQRDSLTSTNILGSRAITDPTGWASFCRLRSGYTPPLLAQARDLTDLFGSRNFRHPEEDTEYNDYNEQICNTRRRNGYLQDLTFYDYLERTCTNSRLPKCLPENRTLLVAEYLNATTDMNNPNGNTAAKNIMPILNGRSGPARINDRQVTTFNEVSRSNARTLASGGTISQTRQTTQLRSNSSAQADLTQSPTFSGSSAVNTLQPETLIVPTSNTGRGPQLRDSLAQGESEAKVIRDEISSLKDVIRKEPAQNRDTQAFATLTERLSALERRLLQKENENRELQNQIADADAERANSSPKPQQQITSIDSRRSSGSVSANVVANSQPQGGVSGGSSMAPASTGGQASLGGGSLSSPSPSRVSSGSNSALLSKYGVRETSVQNGITLASASSAVDYQSLRFQSENSIIPIAVSAEEFDQIKGNNQEALNRYLEQVRAMPGEVVRLNLTAGSDRTMELFIVKNGNEISIVQGPGASRNIASQSGLEVIPEAARENTLEDLRNELGR
jgi:hypothetical protein